MVRRVDRNGQASVWCRKCSGCARQRLGPKIDESMQAAENGRCATNARGWTNEGRKEKGSPGRKAERLREEFEVAGFMAQKKGFWNVQENGGRQGALHRKD